MIRAYMYLFGAGALWLAEGFLFSYYLGFRWWQTVLIAVVYTALYAYAVRRLIRARARPTSPTDGLAHWRYVSVAPMAVIILGSFASLPIVLVVAALGKM